MEAQQLVFAFEVVPFLVLAQQLLAWVVQALLLVEHFLLLAQQADFFWAEVLHAEAPVTGQEPPAPWAW